MFFYILYLVVPYFLLTVEITHERVHIRIRFHFTMLNGFYLYLSRNNGTQDKRRVTYLRNFMKK